MQQDMLQLSTETRHGTVCQAQLNRANAQRHVFIWPCSPAGPNPCIKQCLQYMPAWPKLPNCAPGCSKALVLTHTATLRLCAAALSTVPSPCTLLYALQAWRVALILHTQGTAASTAT